MTNLPKKLPIDGVDKNNKIICNVKDDLVCKINELIDYLQAKEEVDKTWLRKIMSKDKPNYEEASKGEQTSNQEYIDSLNPPKSKEECDLTQCRHCKKDGRAYLLDEKCPCFKEWMVESAKKPTNINPPEHDDVCACEDCTCPGDWCAHCGKRNANQNDKNKLSHDYRVGFYDGGKEVKSFPPEHELSFVPTLTKWQREQLDEHYVSKEKIKREIDKLQKSCYEADGVIDGITALHHLREKL